MALAILLALAIAVFVLYTMFDRVLTSSTSTTVEAYAGNPGTVATLVTSTTEGANTVTTSGQIGGAILVRPSAATASSSMKPTTITDFRPTNLLDGDLASVWVEGADGNGVGQWVRLDFQQAVTMARIEIGNGDQRNNEWFANDERVKSLELQYSDGRSQVVQLQDAQGLQEIKPATTETEWIKLTILSIYPTYTLEDAALSDIRIYETIQ
jgi:hypothetical protein